MNDQVAVDTARALEDSLKQRLRGLLCNAAGSGENYYEFHSEQPRDVVRQVAIEIGMSERNSDYAYTSIWIFSWSRPTTEFERELAASAFRAKEEMASSDWQDAEQV